MTARKPPAKRHDGAAPKRTAKETVQARPRTSVRPRFGPFSPAVTAWLERSFDAPTPAQREAWSEIHAGRSTLLCAPTGSGKTLAAFLWAIDRLMFAKSEGEKPATRVLYVSPLKALAVDVERNLRIPLAGVSRTAAELSLPAHEVTVGVRTGDTAAKERAKLARRPPDILITTPESLFLMLTSEAREGLRSVETVIVDEIHALAATKRGSHLFLSLERLEALRDPALGKPLQRIGLSATQRPLEEVARLLGGGEVSEHGFAPRPVSIVDARSEKQLELVIEVPVDDMTERGARDDDERKLDARTGSIWPSIHPRLVELVRAHHTTMVFVNSRRLAERIAGAINESAGEEIALPHHGSVSREQREIAEERLKAGKLPCIVATSTLELGLDLGAVDLVVQIEAPPSVASGLQRIGRSGHVIGATSRGRIFPKHRADVLACAAAVSAMRHGHIEATRYPRNPLDVLAQQVVAIAAMDDVDVDALYDWVRRAAPFADLSRASFDGVLEMLAGRYPSDEFAELRPRIVWDRTRGTIRARTGAKRLAVVNAGTIPDRGLYGVYLVGGSDEKRSKRVGELDEEMVFECRTGEVILLGASSWRIANITHDRVEVEPAPGEPGRMPFWRGDAAGRSVGLGRAIGEVARKVADARDTDALAMLAAEHALDERAAKNLVRYIREQAEATTEVPSDRNLVIERFLDEMGDWRVCILGPFGGRVFAPLAACLRERLEGELGTAVETIWSDDGIVLRLPESDTPPDVVRFFPAPEEVEELLVRALAETPLFASRFRECAGRALLLPKRHPGKRSPLWAQRRRAYDLLAVASRYGSFPILLETYRECLQDVFDVPALVELLTAIRARRIRVTTADTRIASPFAASLLFSYLSNFIYEGDAPLAERRAQALSIDQAQLRELLGDAELSQLFDPADLEELARRLQRLDGRRAIEHADALHDLVRELGDLTHEELVLRAGEHATQLAETLLKERRAIEVRIGKDKRVVAVEDASRYRDALGTAIPQGVPAAYLAPVPAPLDDLVSRYARTHGPFSADDITSRLHAPRASVTAALERLTAQGRLVPTTLPREHGATTHCDREVLRQLRQRALARLRKEVEPVDAATFTRFCLTWHDVVRPRRHSVDELAAVIERLQGIPLAASVLEEDVIPARLRGYLPNDLDMLCASGEVTWRGVEALTEHTGRIALYLTSAYGELAPTPAEVSDPLALTVRGVMERRGAVFFQEIVRETGGFPRDVLHALWTLVFSGHATNDTFAPLRSLARASTKRAARGRSVPMRRTLLPGSEGRWSLLPTPSSANETERRTRLAQRLLERHGVLTREAVHAEGIAGGFSAIYDVLKAMEERGRIRRGYFIEGLGATQFASVGAVEQLRIAREAPERPETLVLAATDPASPYGAALPWPTDVHDGASLARPQRAAGSHVVLVDGRLAAWLGRAHRTLRTFLPQEDAARERVVRAVADALATHVERGAAPVMLLATIDGTPASSSPLAPVLRERGFVETSRGLLKRRTAAAAMSHARPVRGRGPDWLTPEPPVRGTVQSDEAPGPELAGEDLFDDGLIDELEDLDADDPRADPL